jgi:DNA polymerase
MKKEKLKEIEDQILILKESPLFSYRTENGYFPVIGEGSCDAKIMMVGEAPGRNEAKTGRPFCGTAGKVLDQLLAHVGLVRQDIYITNIVKYRPPDNRDPEQKEKDDCNDWLISEIKIISPELIEDCEINFCAYAS